MSFFRAPATTKSGSMISVVLMLDISQSMQKELQAAKSKLSELPLEIAKRNPNATIQVAVIAFSDYKDDEHFSLKAEDSSYWRDNNTNACRTINFTDIKNATSFLNELSIQKGQDFPEAMELAFYKANQLNWPDSNSFNRIVRQIFYVSDSVPHASSNDESRAFFDDYAIPFKNPANLYWLTEIENLKAKGIEVHVLECGIWGSENQKINSQIATITAGSYSRLEKANDLIALVSSKIQEGDDMDELIGAFKTKVTMQPTDEMTDMVEAFNAVTFDEKKAVQVVAASTGNPLMAVAKVSAYKNRYGFNAPESEVNASASSGTASSVAGLSPSKFG